MAKDHVHSIPKATTVTRTSHDRVDVSIALRGEEAPYFTASLSNAEAAILTQQLTEAR